MSELIEFFAKYAVVQSAVAVVVILWGWQKIIKPGEKEAPDDGHDYDHDRARWKAQQDLSDISENLKRLLVIQQEMSESQRRLTDAIWNRQQSS